MQAKWFRSSALGLSAVAAMLSAASVSNTGVQAKVNSMLIDDFSDRSLTSQLGTKWRGVSDTVMGGISSAAIAHVVDGEDNCLRLTGDVRLENNGGFAQAALNLKADGGTLDASAFTGIRLVAKGNDEQYSVHLRTADNRRPWQSYRAHFTAQADKQTFEIPFSAFEPYRIEAPLDVTQLRRIGLVAIGRRFQADLKVCQLGFYR